VTQSSRSSRKGGGSGRPAPTSGRAARGRGAPPTRSFIERYRTLIIAAVAVVAVGAIGAVAAFNAASPAYACTQEWTAPTGTPAPDPGATPRLGYVQADMGRAHVQPGDFVRYALCPPASGNHINAKTAGPITPHVYGPDDVPEPQGWIHNLEHGALVLLYKCPGDACTDAGQQALKDLYAQFPAGPICNVPPGVIGPIIARFDQMTTPYAVLVWGEVLPLQTLDAKTVLDFWAQEGERTNPERQCPYPSASPSGSPAPSAS
jgi:hypothetical protein